VVHSVLTRLAPFRREEVHPAYDVVVDLVVLGFELAFGVFLRLGHVLRHCAAGYNDQRRVKVAR
jgi:hypothetical protein